MENKPRELAEIIDNEVAKLDIDDLPKSKLKSTKKLTETQMKLAFLVATKPYHQMTNVEMAKQVGYKDVRAFYKTANRPEFKAYVEEIIDSQNKDFYGVVVKELHEIILHGKSEKNRLDGIKIFLSMMGKLQTKTEITHVTKEQMETNEEREARISKLEKELLESSDGIYRPEE